MRLFLPIRERFGRAFEKKKILIIYALLFVIGLVLGIIFVKTPAIYSYHLDRCDRFIDGVCFSDNNVFLIFLERSAGHLLIALVLLLAGMHPVGLVLTPIVILFRSYTFGGSLYIFFSVYRMSGALISLALYIPIHLILDAVFLMTVALSFCRAFGFHFQKGDFLELIKDALIVFLFIVLACLLEMILLLILFHPLGNIL